MSIVGWWKNGQLHWQTLAVGAMGSQLGKLEGGKPTMGHLKAAGLCPVTSLLSAGLPFPHQTHVH